MSKKSVQCHGKTNQKRCTRSVLIDHYESEMEVLCWEHQDLLLHKIAESKISKPKTFEMQVQKKKVERLQELSLDEENVHTPEVNSLLQKSIENLKRWAQAHKIKTEKSLSETIETYLLSNEGRVWRGHSKVFGALLHLRECYFLEDDMVLLKVTYPQLSSWVWNRIIQTKDYDKKMLLLERFFEEVFESTKLCLNGNMARLMNVFACVDEEIHPQDGSKVYTPEILQTSIYQIIHNLEWDIDEMVHKIRTVLFEAQLPLESWGDWIDAAIDERLNL